jgi:RND family efflux transporter MFP subunit
MTHMHRAAKMSPLLVAALGGVLAGCAGEPRTVPAATETVSNVTVTVAQKTTALDWMEAVGNVRAGQSSQVASQMMGNIVEIRVQEGDRVKPGQVLAIVDDAQPRSRVEQATSAVTAAEKEVSAADSDLALADSTLKRYQQLFEKKSVSPQEFDEIKARYRSAEARRDMALAAKAQANAGLTLTETSLGYARIRAPFAGVITEKKAEAGMLASPGMPIFTIEDTRRYRLEATIDESDMRIARLGQVVPVTIDALGNTELSGKVVQIVPAADPTSRSFLVKIELPSDSRLRSGLFGRARLPRGERTSLLIPRSALVERGQLQGVFVVTANEIAGLRYITLGRTAGDHVEVLSGLQAGEKLITAPGDRELGGKRIAAHP